MTIIVSQKGKNAKQVKKSIIGAEKELQEYIYDNPEMIPLYDIKEDITLLILAREFPTDSGEIDALGIDNEGGIYLIETKLDRNTDKREVVAQALDYGAQLWRNSGGWDVFLTDINEAVHERFPEGLNRKIKDFFGMDDDGVTILLENLKRNLNDGKFKFVVLMDNLESRLKDLITFINKNSQFDIFAVELAFYKHDHYEIVIPKLFGAEVKKDIATVSSGARKVWDEKSFFEDAQNRLDAKGVNAVKKLYDFSTKTADEVSLGTGTARGSYNPKFSKISVKSLYSVYSDGAFHFNSHWLHGTESTVRYRDKFKDELLKIKGFSIPKDYPESSVRFPIEKWCSLVDNVIDAIKNVLNQ